MILGVPAKAKWIKNLTAVAQVAVEAWVWFPVQCSGLKDLPQLQLRCSSDSISELETSISHGCDHKKKKNCDSNGADSAISGRGPRDPFLAFKNPPPPLTLEGSVELIQGWVYDPLRTANKKMNWSIWESNGKFYSSQIEDYNPGTTSQKALRTVPLIRSQSTVWYILSRQRAVHQMTYSSQFT